jgi:hypothetical protein
MPEAACLRGAAKQREAAIDNRKERMQRHDPLMRPSCRGVWDAIAVNYLCYRGRAGGHTGDESNSRNSTDNPLGHRARRWHRHSAHPECKVDAQVRRSRPRCGKFVRRRYPTCSAPQSVNPRASCRRGISRNVFRYRMYQCPFFVLAGPWLAFLTARPKSVIVCRRFAEAVRGAIHWLGTACVEPWHAPGRNHGWRPASLPSC